MEPILLTLNVLFKARSFKTFSHITYTGQEQLVCSAAQLQICFIVEVTEGKGEEIKWKKGQFPPVTSLFKIRRNMFHHSGLYK